ncbi:hypothetical protein GOODEAATRI_023185 [Goodea atripinnis]|uniref:Uncharacterized protein n=1 Tax=Goodea atripinnis TaxID=208336 RepID=A0ABV0PR04_9TELE
MPTVKYGGRSVMLWAHFFLKGLENVVVVNVIMNFPGNFGKKQSGGVIAESFSRIIHTIRSNKHIWLNQYGGGPPWPKPTVFYDYFPEPNPVKINQGKRA